MNGKQIPNEGLTLGMDREKTSVMGNRTLFEVSVIYHSNTGLQITHDVYINGYFLLLFDVTHDRARRRVVRPTPKNSKFRIEMKSNKPLPEAISCLLYVEFDN